MRMARQGNCFGSAATSRLFQSQYCPGRLMVMPDSRRRLTVTASLSGIGLGICRSSSAIRPEEYILHVLIIFFHLPTEVNSILGRSLVPKGRVACGTHGCVTGQCPNRAK